MKQIDSCYRLVAYIFSRSFVNKCSWTGMTRSGKEGGKIPLKYYKNFPKCFVEMITKADRDFNVNASEICFKRIMKNSARRRKQTSILSKHKRRPNNLKYSKSVANNSKNETTGGDRNRNSNGKDNSDRSDTSNNSEDNSGDEEAEVESN